MRYRRQESRYPTAAAIDRLSADLALAEVGQDWEIEAADSRRVIEFLDYYDTRQLNDDERFTLMSLIIASFDERLSAGRDDVMQDRIVARLTAKFDVLTYLVQYWALPDEDAMDAGFSFTPIARQIMQSMYGDRENWPRTPFAIKRAEQLLREQGVYDSVEIVDKRDGSFELGGARLQGATAAVASFRVSMRPRSSLGASLGSRLTRGVRSNKGRGEGAIQGKRRVRKGGAAPNPYHG